ncbi:MAG: pyridoxamine 5'-phosphate oxidase family protein [Verrucomicrobiales bacterium]
MAKPAPKPIDPTQLVELAQTTMREAKFPMLASVDGDRPRVRPISPVRTDGFTVYIANMRAYKKTKQIALNPNVELCYFAPSHDQVRISGAAEIVTDPGLVAELWQSTPLLQQYLGAADNPELIIYKVVPEHVQFMREWAIDYHEVPITGG